MSDLAAATRPPVLPPRRPRPASREIRARLALLGARPTSAGRRGTPTPRRVRRGARPGGPRLPAAARPQRRRRSSGRAPTGSSRRPAGGSATGCSTHVPGNLLAGDDVLALQQRLLDLGFKVGKVDGRFGHADRAARVRDFQRNVGVAAGRHLRPGHPQGARPARPDRSRGGSPNAMRAEERIRRAGPQLTGKIVVIDPGARPLRRPRSCGCVADAITTDLARADRGPAGRDRRAGLPDQHRRRRDEDPRGATAPSSPTAPARDLCISLQVDGSDNADAAGVSTYFYGSEAHGAASSVGERFAGLVQREIVARTDLRDLRSHAKTWDLLRRTRMPAVRIDAGYLTNAGDAARLADPGFRDVVAEAVVVAVQRVYLDPDDGRLRPASIREASPATLRRRRTGRSTRGSGRGGAPPGGRVRDRVPHRAYGAQQPSAPPRRAR